jgi:phage shock protein A
MGIFTRFRDIISSNLSAMVDKAEDPEKLIRLMIREMEDTLVEIKASCAGVMAERKKAERQLEEITGRSAYWEEKAGMAVEKGRDDLARDALHEKRRYARRIDVLESEITDLNQLVDQYQDDIRQLEEKLKNARNKQRMLTQRHIHAKRKRQAQEDIRRMDSAEVVRKFDDFEGRIERMESEADLVNYGRRTTLEEELDKLNLDDEIEKELETLKGKPVVNEKEQPAE